MKPFLLFLFTLSAYAQPRFEKDILPIFTANCLACHGGRSMVGLDLRTAVSAIRGSSQGPVLIKANSAKSLLFQKISSNVMPPPAFNLKLTDREIETVKQWIDAGCHEDTFATAVKPIFDRRCNTCHSVGVAAGGISFGSYQLLKPHIEFPAGQ